MVDLLRVDGAYDGENMGLYYFDLDLSDIAENLDEDDVKEMYGQYNITKADLLTIIQVVFGVFKVTPAINYVKSTLIPEEKMEYLEYRRFNNYVMYNCPKSLQGIRSLLPVKGKDNMLVRYVQKVCNCNEEAAKDVLDVLFNNLAVEISNIPGVDPFLRKHDTKEAYQIDVN